MNWKVLKWRQNCKKSSNITRYYNKKEISALPSKYVMS